MPTTPATTRRIQARIANAVAALRAASDKLGQGLDELDPNDNLTRWTVTEVRVAGEFVADMADEGYTANVSRDLLHAIAGYQNEQWENPAHLEGAILALSIAKDYLEAALKLAGQFKAEHMEHRYETPFAVWTITKGLIARLEASLAIPLDLDDAQATLMAPRAFAMSA